MFCVVIAASHNNYKSNDIDKCGNIEYILSITTCLKYIFIYCEIILISMYMYGSAELTLVGEKIGQHLYGEIKKIAFLNI